MNIPYSPMKLLLAFFMSLGALLSSVAICVYLHFADGRNHPLQWTAFFLAVIGLALLFYVAVIFKGETSSNTVSRKTSSNLPTGKPDDLLTEITRQTETCWRCNGAGLADSGPQESGQGGSVYSCEVCGGSGSAMPL